MQLWMSWNSLHRPAGLELRDLPPFVYQVLALKACVTTTQRAYLLKSWRGELELNTLNNLTTGSGCQGHKPR